MARFQVVAVRTSGGELHRHIAGICYIDTSESPFKSKTLTIEAAIAHLERGTEMFTRDYKGFIAEVHVVNASDGQKFLRTKADGVWSDNLLKLPRYLED